MLLLQVMLRDTLEDWSCDSIIRYLFCWIGQAPSNFVINIFYSIYNDMGIAEQCFGHDTNAKSAFVKSWPFDA